jgi:flagellar basal body-associated protein FliL
MAAPGAPAKPNVEAKPKVENKPVVESKTPVETKERSWKFWFLIGSAAMLILMGVTLFLSLPSFKGARTALWAKMAGERKVEQVKATLALDPFLVNLADTDDIRFVKTTLQLGLAEEPKEQTKNSVIIAAIRDSIISLLSSKKADQILTPQGKDTLRKEIRARVNALSPKTKVLEVYIVDFVVQL